VSRPALAPLALALVPVLVLGLAAGCDDKVAGGRSDGPAIFAEACARCHGPGGVPDASMVAQLGVKDLTSEHVQRELGDDQIRQRILRGSDNRRMPAFQGALSDAQVDAVVAYVRSLGGGAAPGR
jgi:mono/diheme cytochrome c family protein